MVFSGIPFLFYFLPAVLLLYYAVPRFLKNYVLLAAGLVFYFYGEQLLVLLMLATALIDYTAARVIERFRASRVLPKVALGVALSLDLGILFVFKYADFFIGGVQKLLGLSTALLGVALPLGISFYTFQSMSYTIDVYRGEKAEKNPIVYATYLTLFPQLVAGPIVRYGQVAGELSCRTHTLAGFSSGAFRFVIGLGKKVLIADMLGEFVSRYASLPDKTVVLAWLYALIFSLQIYFDFSGYSDMAIGLGKMFGFSFPENFNYPFIARSLRDFWRRWHMTLSAWFRDYVYIPLGGNRVSRLRWVFNLLAVWLLTGLWHGAALSFLLWGLFFAVFLLMERLFWQKWLDRLPRFVSHVYVTVALLVSFVLFSAADSLGGLGGGVIHIASMFGGGGLAFANAQTLYYLRDYALPLGLAIVGATPLLSKGWKALEGRFPRFQLLRPAVLFGILFLCTAQMADAGSRFFLYFNF